MEEVGDSEQEMEENAQIPTTVMTPNRASPPPSAIPTTTQPSPSELPPPTQPPTTTEAPPSEQPPTEVVVEEEEEEVVKSRVLPLQKTSQIWTWIDDMLDERFVDRLLLTLADEQSALLLLVSARMATQKSQDQPSLAQFNQLARQVSSSVEQARVQNRSHCLN